MTKQTLILAVGAMIIFGGGLWLGSIRTAEAPATIETITTNETEEATAAIENFVESTTTTILTNDTAQAALNNVNPTPKPVAKPAVSTAPYTMTVTYDGERFTPKEVTVLKGATVRWVNLSTQSLWVASNLHPVHTGYPIRSENDCAGSIFDMCKSIGKGESWSFKFDREGTWKYHNHKSTRIEGSVEVNLPGDKPSIPGN